MVSTKKEPVSRPATMGPPTVIMGLRAFLKTWTSMTPRSLTPLARAVRT
jgi:hypothetical protein